MNVEFDWRVGDQDNSEETLAQLRKRERPPWPWWVWVLLVGIVSATALGGVLYVRHRLSQAEQRIAFQIQSVIDLEARAYARKDAGLYLEQQDSRSSEWYDLQSLRVSAACLESSAVTERPEEIPDHICQPVLAAQIQDIDLRGDTAWVEVLEGNPVLRRVRLYRRTNQGWKHTAPQESFWGVAIELDYGGLVFRYHRRDEPYVNPIVVAAAETFDEVCTELGCVLEALPQFDFAVRVAPGATPQQTDGVYLLDSPWLAGLPLDGTRQSPYQDQIEYAVAYDLASQSLQRMAGTDQETNLIAAMAHEYAVWKSEGTVDKAPILKRLVAVHGEATLPEILRSLEHVRTLNVVLVQWLLVSPTDRPVDYFQTLLNIEQEALSAGSKETFLLLQDSAEPDWVEQQQALYARLQSERDLDFPPVKVQAVEVSGDLARVTLEAPTYGERPLGLPDQTAFFRRREGDWKRSPGIAHVSATVPSSTPRSSSGITHAEGM